MSKKTSVANGSFLDHLSPFPFTHAASRDQRHNNNNRQSMNDISHRCTSRYARQILPDA